MTELARSEMIEKIARAVKRANLSQRVEMKEILGLPLPATKDTPFVTVSTGLEELSTTDVSILYDRFVEKGFIK